MNKLKLKLNNIILIYIFIFTISMCINQVMAYKQTFNANMLENIQNSAKISDKLMNALGIQKNEAVLAYRINMKAATCADTAWTTETFRDINYVHHSNRLTYGTRKVGFHFTLNTKYDDTSGPEVPKNYVYQKGMTTMSGFSQPTGYFKVDIQYTNPYYYYITNYNVYRYKIESKNCTRYDDAVLSKAQLNKIRNDVKHKISEYPSVAAANQAGVFEDQTYVSNINVPAVEKYPASPELDSAYNFFAKVPEFKNTQLNGVQNPQNSAINEYDNLIILPKTTYREVFVRHINIKTGELITTEPNRTIQIQYEKIIKDEPNIIDQIGKYNPMMGTAYSEFYRFETGNWVMSLSRLSNPKIGGKTAKYVGFKSQVFLNPKVKDGPIAKQRTNSGLSTNQYFAERITGTEATTTNQEDHIFVDFYYDPDAKDDGEVVAPNPINLVGSLAFVSVDSAYKATTSSDTLDFIPSSEKMFPYVSRAYPYILRGLKYTPKTDSGTATIKVTMAQNFTEYWWVWRSDEEGNRWTEDREQTTEFKTSFNYKIPYKYLYYKIDNFKMYRISKVEVYDSTSNIGGVLFEKGDHTYTLQMSKKYSQRFTQNYNYLRDYTFYWNGEDVGKVDQHYQLEDLDDDCGGPGRSGCGEVKRAKRDEFNSITAEDAARKNDLIAVFWSTNDYVQVDDIENENKFEHSESGASLNADSEFKSQGKYVLDPVFKQTTVKLWNIREVLLDNQSNSTYIKNVSYYTKPTNRMTELSDFVEQPLLVPDRRYNGQRNLKGRIYYEVMDNTGSNNYNTGGNSFSDTTLRLSITNNHLQPISKLYDIYEGSNQNVNKVNVYTPVNIRGTEVKSEAIVNQSESSQGTNVIQKNAEFTITPKGGSETKYGLSSVNKFIKFFYVSFDFDLESYKITGATGGNEGRNVKAGTWIRVPRDGSIKGRAAVNLDSSNDVSVINQKNNSYYIRAIAINIPDSLEETIRTMEYPGTSASAPKDKRGGTLVDKDSNISSLVLLSISRQTTYYGRSDVKYDANHAAEAEFVTTNLGRMYDFKITDCMDLDFKDVFRINQNGVNVSSGKYYYAGKTKWLMNYSGTNELVGRSEAEIGSNPLRILPLGPYKQTAYLRAPKMGYRISFDLKTSGYIDTTKSDSRYIDITPEYYYISKDGSVIKDVTLYYKNSNNKYVTLAGSGYSIYFKPNDGYRYLNNIGVAPDFSHMSTNLENLSIDGTMRLNQKMMSISSNKFVQAWYGEFKLPNSTIALEKGKTNLNNPLKDGYLAVKLNIVAVDNPTGTESGKVRLGYSYNNKVQGTTTQIPNTSQWDYEGYLGYSRHGIEISASNMVTMQLEKGILKVTDQSRYDKIKGTVLLYDLDNRAATDFE